MNKKVLSAILFSALFAGTGTFTSCIDNDEPAGIEELRGAKAELIRAKVAVEQAQAEYKKAEATKVLAEAAKVQAQAKIEEAKAKIEEAKAEAEAALTAEAKAKAEAVVDSIQREMEVAALEHQATLLQKQESLAEAQRSYEIALKQIEIAEALMSEKNKVAVSALVAAVEAAQTEVNAALANYQRIQDKVYGIQLQGEIDSVYDAKKAAHDLKYAEIVLAEKEATLAKYQGFMEKEAAETADWRAEIEEIEDSLKQLAKEDALIKLEMQQVLFTDAYKAYNDTLTDAKEAVTAAVKAKADMKLAEALVDTLLWYNNKQNNDIVKFDKGTNVADVVSTLTGGKYATEEDSAKWEGLIKDLRIEHDSYTAERQYWLDSLKNKLAEGPATQKKNAEEAKKAYTDAKAAYAAGKALSYATIDNGKNGDEAAGAWFDFVKDVKAEGKDGDAKTEAILLAKQTFADKLVAYYKSLPAAQVTLNTITLGTSVDGTMTYETKSAEAWLTGNAKASNLGKLLKYFNGDVDVDFANLNKAVAEKLWKLNGEGTGETVEAGKKESVKALSVVKTWKELSATPDYTYADDKYTSKSLLGDLIIASKVAFGNAADYAKASDFDNTTVKQKEYLQDVPTNDDIKYVSLMLGKGVGTWGNYVLSQDKEADYLTNNHKAIKADLKAAIDKLTAFVKSVKGDIKVADANIKAAQDAQIVAQGKLDDYIAEVNEEFNDRKTANAYASMELSVIKSALINAVNAFLPEGSYQNATQFANWLATQVKNAEKAVIDEEKTVAAKDMVVKKVAAGIFTNSEALIGAEYELNRVEEELAKAEKALADALAALATAEEIWNAAE